MRTADWQVLWHGTYVRADLHMRKHAFNQEEGYLQSDWGGVWYLICMLAYMHMHIRTNTHMHIHTLFAVGGWGIHNSSYIYTYISTYLHAYIVCSGLMRPSSERISKLYGPSRFHQTVSVVYAHVCKSTCRYMYRGFHIYALAALCGRICVGVCMCTRICSAGTHIRSRALELHINVFIYTYTYVYVMHTHINYYVHDILQSFELIHKPWNIWIVLSMYAYMWHCTQHLSDSVLHTKYDSHMQEFLYVYVPRRIHIYIKSPRCACVCMYIYYTHTHTHTHIITCGARWSPWSKLVQAQPFEATMLWLKFIAIDDCDSSSLQRMTLSRYCCRWHVGYSRRRWQGDIMYMCVCVCTYV
jgi:hypothetical protein